MLQALANAASLLLYTDYYIHISIDTAADVPSCKHHDSAPAQLDPMKREQNHQNLRQKDREKREGWIQNHTERKRKKDIDGAVNKGNKGSVSAHVSRA